MGVALLLDCFVGLGLICWPAIVVSCLWVEHYATCRVLFAVALGYCRFVYLLYLWVCIVGMDLGFSFGCLTLGCWFGFDCVVVRYYCCLL